MTNAVTKLSVNSTNAEIYSDSTFATATGIALHNNNNMFVTAGSNAAGQLVVSTITTSSLPTSISFQYDLNGNLLNDGLKSYEYDDFNQLTAVSLPGQWRTEFVYDGLGRRRIVRDYAWAGAGWTRTNETRYICDGVNILQERDSNNVAQVTYTRGLDISGTFGGAGGIGGLLARSEGSSHLYYHSDKMTTKKLLVAFDPQKPDHRSSDFLVVVLEGTEAMFVGVKSKKTITSGLLVYLGTEVKVNDLFAKLVDTGLKIHSVERTVRTLEHYIEKLQDFRIGNLLSVESDTINGFKLVKLADAPPNASTSKLP